MAYVPINLNIFSAAYAGAMAAFGSSSYAGPTVQPFSNEADIALAFAQAIDTQWNNVATPTTFDVETTFDAAVILMRDRGPFPSAAPLTNVSNWTASANQIVSSILSGEIAANAAGITFPPWATGLPGGTQYVQGGNTFGALATLGTLDGNDLRFITNGGEVVRVTTTGRVGIGNAAPASALDVTGSINASVQVIVPLAGSVITQQIRDTNNNNWLEATAAVGAVNNFRMLNAATGSPVVLEAVGGDVDIGIKYRSRGTGTMSFRPGSDTSTAFQVTKANDITVVLSVDTTSARVGINQAAPTQALDVTGTGRITTALITPALLDSGSVAYIQGTATDRFLLDLNGNKWLTGSTTASAVNFIDIQNAATGNRPTISGTGTDANVGLRFKTKGTSSFEFFPGTNSTIAFEIRNAAESTTIFSVDTTNQRVGILQTAPSFALDVTGTGRFTTAVQTLTLNDTNGNAWLTGTATGSAVNNINITNKATGQGPVIQSEGSDTNIGMTFLTKGTGVFTYKVGSNGINAFQVQTSTGTKVLTVDTTNQRVGISAGAASTPFSALSVEDAVSGAGTFVCDINNTTGGTTNNSVLELQGGNNTGVATSEMISFLRTDSTQIGRVTQNAATTVAYNTSSDRRIKENIKPTKRGLKTLERVKVRDFNFTTDPTKKRTQGFIAQELSKIYPEAVSRGGRNPRRQPWSVEYGRLSPLLVQAVQELSAEVKRLQKEVKRLKKAGK